MTFKHVRDLRADRQAAQTSLGYGDGPFEDLPDYAREDVDSVASAIATARRLERKRLLGSFHNFANAQTLEAIGQTNRDVQRGMESVINMIHAVISVENR